MTHQDQPMVVGIRDSQMILLLAFGVAIDIGLVAAGISLVTNSRRLSGLGVFGVVVLIAIVGVGWSWFIWRLARVRVEISSDQVVEVGVVRRRSIPMSDVLRIEVVDGGSLQKPIRGEDGARLYVPVIRTRVTQDELPVRQLADMSRKVAGTNGDSLRWYFDRANRQRTSPDPSTDPGIVWPDENGS